MTFHEANPGVTYAANPQYVRNSTAIQGQAYAQTIPVENYRVSATSPIRVSQAVLQQQGIAPQARSIVVNANQGVRASYDFNANIVGVAAPPTTQSIVQRKMVPVTQYVPIDVIETVPAVAVSPQIIPQYNLTSASYVETAPIAQTQQRVIVH